MGEIVFWTIIRTIIIIPAVWLLRGYLDFEIWFVLNIFIIYLVIIHPTITQYRLFEEKNKDIVESTLCSSCIHFDKSAILCLKHDLHPTEKFLPCEGLDWEPKSSVKNPD
ncbi:MAG: hypothetical protein HXY50_14025 [Ignavibacteriaceae bacterium]|nr:hypothetical protein [Ignavibacteriaceae bacterium]